MSKVYRRDSAGIAGVLNSSAIRAMVSDAVSRIEARANAHLASLPDSDGVEVHGAVLTTDRPHGVVGVVARFQAVDGVLTRAASECGLEVSASGGSGRLLDYVTKSGKKRKATAAQVANWTRGAK